MIKVGQQVAHPAKGAGTVATLVYSFPHRVATEAWVDFERIGKRLVRVKDLTAVEPVAEAA